MMMMMMTSARHCGTGMGTRPAPKGVLRTATPLRSSSFQIILLIPVAIACARDAVFRSAGKRRAMIVRAIGSGMHLARNLHIRSLFNARFIIAKGGKYVAK